MASGLLGMQVSRKGLWVRVPCPPLELLYFCVKPNFPPERFG